MTANNSPHQGTATSEVGGLCGCLPDFVPLGASLSVATFLKIYTDFSSKFENWWSVAAVCCPGCEAYHRLCEALLIEDPVGVRARLHIYLHVCVDSRYNSSQNVLGFEERMFQNTCICMRSDESS